MSGKGVEVAVEAIKSPDVSVRPETDEDDIDDQSSIEALNWSDFDEEEMEAARQFAAKEFPHDLPVGPENVNKSADEEVTEESKDMMEVKMTSSQESSASAVTVEEDVETKSEDDDSPATVILAASSQEEFPNIDYPPEDNEMVQEVEENKEGDELRKKEALGSMLSVTSNASKEDSASNAPVLDDGPIWGKGEKLYKFHENRTINQKLTFGVLISVVLAVGIGLGNLVAYNEYEGEHPSTHKTEHFHCPASRVPLADKAAGGDISVTSGFPSSTHIKEGKAGSEGPLDERGSPTPDRYSSQQDALAYVVKSIDELSKKLDHFENTTRQLGGIIVMSEEARMSRNSPKHVANEALKKQEFSDKLPQWDSSRDHPVKFSEVVHNDKQSVSTPDLIVTTESVSDQNIEPRQTQFGQESSFVNAIVNDEQVRNKPTESVRMKDPKKRIPLDNFQWVHQKENSKKAKTVPQEALRGDGFVVVNENNKRTKTVKWEKPPRRSNHPEDSFQKQELKREKSPQPAAQQLRRERPPQPQREDIIHNRYPQREEFKREKSPSPPVQQGQKLPPRGDSRRDNSVPREEFTRDRPPTRKHGKGGRSASPSAVNEDSVIKPIPPASKHAQPRVEKYVRPDVIYIPEAQSENVHDKENRKQKKKWNKNKHEDNSSSEEYIYGSKSNKISKKPKYDDKVMFDAEDMSNRYRDNPDWDLERAKLRENQRIQQHWNNDFRASDRQRKRQQNWQIERDRVREKFRKAH